MRPSTNTNIKATGTDRIQMDLTGPELAVLASDKGMAKFANQLVMARLWCELKDFIDKVFGETCFYASWDYELSDQIVIVSHFKVYDKDMKYIEMNTEVSDSIELYFCDDADFTNLIFAFNILAWDRHAIDVGDDRIDI